MSDLLDQIAASQSENAAVQEEVDAYVKKKHASDQSGIAWLIIIAFVISLALLFLLVFINNNPVSGCTPTATVSCPLQWQEPAKFLLGIISSVMLPIVTLVLGYYFGTEQKNK